MTDDMKFKATYQRGTNKRVGLGRATTPIRQTRSFPLHNVRTLLSVKATMFVPRSLRCKEANQTVHSRKSKFGHRRNAEIKKVELIDERASESRDSFVEKEALSKLTTTTTANPTIQACPSTQSHSNDEESDDEEEIISYSKNQRWPTPGEPVCVVCGRYGAYIVDQTDSDVCSLECKAKHLKNTTRKKAQELLDDTNSGSDQIHERTSSSTGIMKITNSSDGSGRSSIADSREFYFHYKEHPFISGLSVRQVVDIQRNLNIKVKGDSISKPILEFLHCQLSEMLTKNLAHFGYVTPTPIQMQVIPVGLSSRDILACAQTGSGKTAAFLVPMIQRIYSEIDFSFQNGTSFNMNNPLGLIMAPTRELCMQIEKQAKELMQGLHHMKTALLIGGVPIPPQLHRLRSGVQIIVATPGRLQEILTQSGVHLSLIKVFVLDEVDTMLQMGFEQQVQAVTEKLPEVKQTLMFSATIPSSIESMAAKLLVNPVYISVGSPSAPNASVKQIVLWVEDKSKKRRLFSILQDSKHFRPPVVVFVDSKMGADLLAEAVHEVCGLPCLSMHGDKSQNERSRVLESFLAGECPVLVCTALLGRGIDLPNVSQVINFDMPSSVEEYVHQVGRAGRLGKTGLALTFINNTNKAVFLDLSETLQPLDVHLPEELVNSPYLLQQKQRTKQTARKRKHRDTLLTQENLMDLIKKNTTRRQKSS